MISTDMLELSECSLLRDASQVITCLGYHGKVLPSSFIDAMEERGCFEREIDFRPMAKKSNIKHIEIIRYITKTDAKSICQALAQGVKHD